MINNDKHTTIIVRKLHQVTCVTKRHCYSALEYAVLGLQNSINCINYN